jgi:polyphosphate kinase 2 (PPK2 family)
MWVRSGIRLYKYWFSVNREEQERRFRKRARDPLRRWKLSPIHLEASMNWDAYTEAKEVMFFHTHTVEAPWTVVKSSDKKRARINVLRHFVHSLTYPGKHKRAAKKADPLIVGSWPAGDPVVDP